MKKILAFLSLTAFIFSCTETDLLDETGKMELTEFNLPLLPENYFYEGWLLVDGYYVSVGRINNDSLLITRARFSEIEVNVLIAAQSFALTVESSGSPAPSNYVLLAGNFDGNTANLKSDTELSNGVSTLAKRISAAYTVQNASVPEANQNEYGVNGVWFFKGVGNLAETTLQLEYGDIKYQAWLIKTVNNLDYNLNIGVIDNDTIADNSRMFIPSAFASNIPDFPGEDFLQLPSNTDSSYPEGFFPVDVSGSKLILTPIPTGYNQIEIPFPITLLEAEIPVDAQKNPDLTREMSINTQFGAKAIKL